MTQASSRPWSWLLLALAIVVAGCDRTPQLVPAAADSTATGDSLAILTRIAGERWADGKGDEAAVASARVLRMRLAADPAVVWSDRSRTLLDSLGIAAEVAGFDRFVAVNLFSRTEVDGPTWPHLFWFEDGTVRMQVIEGRAMRLMGANARRFEDGAATDSSQVAVLWGRKVASGVQPLLLTWRHAAGGRWDLAQTLGADSLGGTGRGEFVGEDLVTRTWRATPYFDENCANCPHVIRERRFEWGPDGYTRISDSIVPSPYATFTAFIHALASADRESAERLVVDPSLIEFAQRYEWHDPALGRWRAAPGSDLSASELVFFRGRQDAYRVSFQSRGNGFVVLGFEAVPRSVE